MTALWIAGGFTAGYLAVTLWLCRGLRLDARSLCLGALACALTLVLSAVRIPLPTGSSITCGGMLPLMVLALVWDPRLAMVAGWVCGVLAMLFLPGWQPVHWAQVFVEHLVCFSSLGYAGILGTSPRWRVGCAAALAVLLKVAGHVLSGVVFFSQNAWDGWGAWGYSLAYNLSSHLTEGVISLVILLLLPLGVFRRAAGRREL